MGTVRKRRLGVIDLGTHTCRLLVAERPPEGDPALAVLHDELTFVRLGEGVDERGELSEAAIARAQAAVAGFVSTSTALGAPAPLVVATSASRDARNRSALVAALEHAGAAVEIISGEQEARLTLAGALLGAGAEAITLIDIGGGSTEIASGRLAAHLSDVRVDDIRSIDVGCVRLRERLWPSLPPSEAGVGQLRQTVREALAEADVPVARAPVWGVAGTVACVAALEAGHPQLRRDRLQGLEVSAEAVSAWAHRLARLDEPAVLALSRELLTGRSAVIAAGAAILDELMRHLQAPALRVSTWDLRHGRAAQLVAH